MTPTYPKDALCICGHTNYYHPKSKDKKLDKFPCTWCNEQWKFCKCKDFKLANQKGETTVSEEKKEKVKKAKKVKVARVPKAKKEKQLLVTRYKASESQESAKKSMLLLDKENTTQRALVFRAINEAKEPITIDDIISSLDKRTLKSEAKDLEHNVRYYLHYLRADGLVLRTKEREPITA